MTYDVLIVGAGVVGLSIAYHVAAAGGKVAVVEREFPGAGASGAAAGMLAAQIEPDGETPLYRLCTWSRSLYPAFAAALAADSGLSVELVTGGILELAQSDADRERLQCTVQWQQASGQQARWLDAAAAQDWVPGAPALQGALLAPADGHVHPGRLVEALLASCRARGVALHVGQDVTGLLGPPGRAAGVRTAHTEFPAGAVVLASGAQTGALADRLGLALPVFPVKGQILALDAAHTAPGPWIRHGTAVYGEGCYLVPRRDGQVVVGATAEPAAAFDRRVTASGVAGLLTAAARLSPALGAATFLRAWTGLRPAATDFLPVLGPVPEQPGLFVATGHFRNGILLTPATGRVLAAQLAGKAPAADVSAFSAERFLD